MKPKDKPKFDLQQIGERIERLISKSQYNNTETAQKLGITIQALSNIINGKTLPSTKTLLNVSELFDTTIDYILTGKEPEDITFHRYKEITEEAYKKIKDMELGYMTGEINRMLKEAGMYKNISIMYLLKIIINLLKGDNETALELIRNSNDETYQMLKKLNIKLIESYDQRREGKK